MKRDIYIGDLHGCFAELELLLRHLDVQPEDRLISCGDLVDRGPDSVRLWAFFRDRPNSVVIMGNHERKHVRRTLSLSQEIVKRQFGELYPAFVEWASKLPYAFETEHCIAVHGGFEDGVALDRQREEVLSGTTSGGKYLTAKYDGTYWPERYTGDKPIIFGHHIVGREPRKFGDKVYALDTGVCHGGRLSALVVPGFTFHSVPAVADHWAETKRVWQARMLAARPWSSYRWSKIERELGALSRAKRPDLVAFHDRLRGWRDAILDGLPAIVEAAERRAEALRASVDEGALKSRIACEPGAPVLFAALAGSLTVETAKAALPDPDAVFAVAESLRVELPGARSGP